MPYVICPKHGGAPAPLVCSHLADKINDGGSVSEPAVVEAEYLGQIAWRVRLCQQCAAQLGYSETNTTFHGEIGLDQVFGIENQVPVCWECFRESCADASTTN